MRNFKSILIILFVLVVIYFFNEIQYSLLYVHFSWTLSYLTPYFITFFLGVYLSFLLKVKTSKKWINFISNILMLLFPFALTFAIHPIFEGDLNKNGSLCSKINTEEIKGYNLIVYSLPNCKFCHESIPKINMLKKRNKNIKIKYVVLSSNHKDNSKLRIKLDQNIQVESCKNSFEALKITGGKFPTFLLLGKECMKWNNKQFGTAALDLVEEKFKNK